MIKRAETQFVMALACQEILDKVPGLSAFHPISPFIPRRGVALKYAIKMFGLNFD